MTRARALFGSLVLAVVCAQASTAEAQLLVDRAQQIGGLWVIPNLNNPDRYNYIPHTARLARNEAGEPLFSLTFYVSEAPVALAEGTGAAESIVTAEGGAILHVLMEYGTDPKLVSDAEKALRQKLDNDDIQISGPVIFDDGTFSVISSVLTAEGARSATVVAQRPAPLLEGQRVALSFELEPRLANILLATLKTATPDLSVAFELGFHGLTEAYDAEMVIDWAKTKESLQAGGGVQIYVVSLDAQAAIEKVFQDGGIKLVVNGDDAAMDAIVQLAYERALEILYSPIEVEDAPEAERGGLLESIGGLLGNQQGAASSVGFGLSGSFRMKNLKQTGETRMTLNKRGTVQRKALLTVNLGDLYARYGNDGRFFRVESTADSDFDQRRVFVLVDGALKPEVGSFVNSVEVALRKRHGSGDVTMRELVINGSTAGDGTKPLGPLTYNNRGDADSEQWLQYDYKTSWDFRGGGKYHTAWTSKSAATIGLTAPYRRQVVEIDGDLKSLADRGVRAIVVEVSNDFFGEKKTQRRTIRPAADQPIEPISLVMPEGSFNYRYKVTWVFQNGARRETSGVDDVGFVFLNELPAPDPPDGDGD